MEMRKETKKAINKASNAIGTIYFLLLGAVYAIAIILNVPAIIGFIWYIMGPIVASKILILSEVPKITKYITQHNYQIIIKTVKKQLILLGVIYCLVTLNIVFVIPIICTYVYSAKGILESIKKAAHAKFKAQQHTMQTK